MMLIAEMKVTIAIYDDDEAHIAALMQGLEDAMKTHAETHYADETHVTVGSRRIRELKAAPKKSWCEVIVD